MCSSSVPVFFTILPFELRSEESALTFLLNVPPVYLQILEDYRRVTNPAKFSSIKHS